VEIRIDNIESAVVKKLLQEHHDDMLKHSPVESVHALDFSSLREASITFYTAWDNGQLAGCAALNRLDDKQVELKSMKTSTSFLRRGVAAKLLSYLLIEAQKKGYEKISLETGTADVFIPAQKLYKRFEFTSCPPFSDYQEDPYSMFFTKDLTN